MADMRKNGCQLYQEQFKNEVNPSTQNPFTLFDQCPTCVNVAISQHPHQPAIATADKRSRTDDQKTEGEAAQKRTQAAPGLSSADIATMCERFGAMRSAGTTVEQLSDPTQFVQLPFPQSFLPLPQDRFVIDHGRFSYMGREQFGGICRKWEECMNKSGLLRINVYGTPGYGKSHMLAALAVHLVQIKARVVYISDCYQLVQSPVDIMRKALLAAFIDDSAVCEHIKNAGTTDALVNACMHVRGQAIQLTFIVDQTNAFDPLPDVPESTQDLQRKGEAKQLVDTCSSGHVIVCGASANNQTAKHFRHRQQSSIGFTFDLNGGFSSAELKAWMDKYGAALPLLDPVHKGADLQRLLHYTGAVPFFLFLFLSIAKDQSAGLPAAAAFDLCWEQFVRLQPIQLIGEKLRKSINGLLKTKDSDPATFKTVRAFLTGCLSESSVASGIPQTDYDCRYFWRDECGIGRCLTGFVRDTMSMLLHELHVFADWVTPQYMFSAIAGSRNPSVRGFLVEQACISGIMTTAAEYLPGLTFRPSELRYFDRGSEDGAFVHDAFCTLYVPRPFNYKAVDAVLRILPAYAQDSDFTPAASANAVAAMKSRPVVVIAVQITLQPAAQHESSIPAFFANRSVWLSHVTRADGALCTDSDAQWLFHWVVPKKSNPALAAAAVREEVQSIRRETRRGVKVVIPAYAVLTRSVESVTGRDDLLRTPPPSPTK